MPPDTLDPAVDPLPAVARLERHLIMSVIAVTLALLVLATGYISNVALSGFEREVRPEIGREAAAIGNNLAAQIGRAVSMGVPPDQLIGLEPFFQQTLSNRPILNSIQLDMPSGTHLAKRRGATGAVQDISIPVETDGAAIGTFHLGVNPSILERSAADSRWDIAVVLLVALLTTVEVLIFLIDRYVSTPLRMVERLAGRIAMGDLSTRAGPSSLDAVGRFLFALGAAVRKMNDRRSYLAWLSAQVVLEAPHSRAAVGRIMATIGGSASFAERALRVDPPPRSAALARAPLFLYVFAEQLSTSFIPIFAKSLPGSWAPQALAVGLPITVFAGVIGLASPFGASLVGRLGARTVLAIGCFPAIAGYLLTAQAASVEEFTAWRALSAVGYALITIACQSYLVEAGKTGPRGRNMAVFVLAAMTGAVCGTAIGAVLADRIGYRQTFVISAALTAVAGLLTLRTMDRLAGRRRAVKAEGQKGYFWEALSNPRFFGLLVFGAMPAKLVLTGFVFYIGPLFLSALDNTQPEIGRQMMLYSATMLLTIRAGAWVADRLRASSTSIAVAGAATGIGLLLALVLPPSMAMTVGIAVVGLSQGLASAPLLAVVPELCPAMAERFGVATLYGYVRLGERMGSIIGPILAGVLVSYFGFVPAIAAIGVISLLSAVAYRILAGSGERA